MIDWGKTSLEDSRFSDNSSRITNLARQDTAERKFQQSAVCKQFTFLGRFFLKRNMIETTWQKKKKRNMIETAGLATIMKKSEAIIWHHNVYL